MPIIDCDVHPYANSTEEVIPYFPTAWQQRFREQKLALTGRSADRYPHPTGALRQDAIPPGGGLPASDPAYTREELLDRYDVAAAVLIPIQASAVAAWTDRVRAGVYLRGVNDYFLDTWPAVDARFKVTITANPHDPEQGAEEVRRLSADRRVIAVSLPIIGTLMGSKYYHPIYEAASEAGLPVMVHPSGSEGSYAGAPPLAGGVPRTYAERHALLPQVAQASLASLIFEGTFERYPELRVMFVEFGFSWLATFMWRLDREWQNFRADTPWVKRPPSEYVRQFVRLTTQPIDEPAKREHLWEVMELMHADEVLLFASDYPHYDNDNPMLVRDSVLPPAYRERILYDNAKELFGDRV